MSNADLVISTAAWRAAREGQARASLCTVARNLSGADQYSKDQIQSLQDSSCEADKLVDSYATSDETPFIDDPDKAADPDHRRRIHAVTLNSAAAVLARDAVTVQDAQARLEILLQSSWYRNYPDIGQAGVSKFLQVAKTKGLDVPVTVGVQLPTRNHVSP